MNEPIPRLEPWLETTLAAEGEGAEVPLDVHSRLRERLSAELAAPTVAEHRHTPSRGRVSDAPLLRSVLGKSLAIFAAGATAGALGRGAFVAKPKPEVVYVDRVAPAVSSTAPAVASAPPVATPATAPSGETPAIPATVSRPRAVEPPPPGDLAAEQATVETARSALARGDGAAALDAAARHTRLYPRGQLSEECDALTVQALVALGRLDEARARGRQFLAKYPRGFFRSVVEQSLDSSR